jgi:hypothetical protein
MQLKSLKCDGSMTWTVFHCQFEEMCDQNGWESREATHLTFRQGHTADILQCPSQIGIGTHHRDTEGPLSAHS